MRYELRRRLYSQNFLRNPKLISKLIRLSSIGKNDTVLDIGPGRGTITSILSKSAKKVIAVELDNKLYLYLLNKFKSVNNLELHNGNILNFNLPDYPYKVFANIPFIITADIVRKITDNDYFSECYLIVQMEAAKKFIGIPVDNRNQMVAVLLKPWFEISIFWEFSRFDFVPVPRTEAVMIKIKRRKNPLINTVQKQEFTDYIVYIFNKEKVSKLSFENLLQRFAIFSKTAGSKQKRYVAKKSQAVVSKQKNLHKIHRTRRDRNWRRFK